MAATIFGSTVRFGTVGEIRAYVSSVLGECTPTFDTDAIVSEIHQQAKVEDTGLMAWSNWDFWTIAERHGLAEQD